MKTKNVQVSFYVTGKVVTEVEIPDNLTIEEFQRGLNNGDYATSICPNAPVINLMAGCADIGKVIELVEPDLEYTDYEVTE